MGIGNSFSAMNPKISNLDLEVPRTVFIFHELRYQFFLSYNQGGLQGQDGRDRLQQAGGRPEAHSHGAALAEAHPLHHRRVGRDQARLQVSMNKYCAVYRVSLQVISPG